VPPILNRSVIDEILTVSDLDATRMARRLAREEGIVAGFSSGAALHAASVLAAREELRAATIVVVLPDTGERYLSAGLYDDHPTGAP
jgi:cysteine synthase A